MEEEGEEDKYRATEGGGSEGSIINHGIRRSGGHVGGCEGDHVSLEEIKLPTRGGRWCGQGSGLNVYYTETDTLVLTLHAAATTQGEYFDNPLRFKIKYKFLRRERAVVRYGRGSGTKYRGEPVRNSECSRVFQGCRARQCRLQSPNFPGLYPRNVTCYYLVKALPAPSPNLVPVITLSQGNDRLVHVGRQGHGGRVSPEARLRQGDECRAPEDYMLVYDGGSMKSPLLSKMCGTATIPNITSSGPEMLVVFETATSGMMNHLPNLVAGFELQAHILFRKMSSNLVPNSLCSQVIKSFGGNSGTVLSPVFSMPANTTCSYEFQGRRGEIVWLYFTKYYRVNRKQVLMSYMPCRNRLAIYNRGSISNSEIEDTKPVAEFCDEQLPPICIRSRQKGTVSKPCTAKESYLSSGSSMAVTQQFTDASTLLPLKYAIHYEFVMVTQTGREPGSDCDKVFTSTKESRGHFSSPKNVFLFGRGGKSSLSCKYTFQTKPGEAVRLKITNVGFRGNMCKTVHNAQSNLYECIARLPGSAVLEVWEEPWQHTRLPLGCMCDAGVAPATFLSQTRLVQLRLAIKDMSWAQDFNDFFFDAEYEFVKMKECVGERILNGSTGAITIESNAESGECNGFPWKIMAREHSHLYLNIPGYHASSQRCSTDNRVVVYGSHTARPIKSVCPENNAINSIDVFSSGWNTVLDYTEPLQDCLIIRYLARSPAKYTMTWLEVRREPRPSALESLKSSDARGHHTSAATCPHLCPKLDACINPELWCDGEKHCPSGADEQRTACLYFTVPWLYLALGGIAIIVILVIFTSVLVSVRVYQRGKVKRKKKKEAQRLMTREVILPLNFHKETIY
ncbi:hypothetical protein Pcinc_040405 [Petrolisthes cinctipes]|uniref:CUB domain-containing protein n=1 Tax=Petrolisthes cinctipes TaxID=88211 RepID=A0AAE1BMV8_PETCI|nr:hypothetical protein Pcinc_040405 [Petrolisthes cinctipes]